MRLTADPACALEIELCLTACKVSALPQAYQLIACCTYQPLLDEYLVVGNLLVDANLRIKVADFGLSRIKQDIHPLTAGLGVPSM